MDQKLTMLSKVPMFAGCGRRDLVEVGRLADEITVRPGKVLTKEGATGHEFFVIVDGTVEITKGGKPVAKLGPGDYFGELALLGKVPRTATATASTPATLFVLGHREFTSLLAEHPAIREKVLRSVAKWISEVVPGRTS
jgi:CRP-like cAMP-binding protein